MSGPRHRTSWLSQNYDKLALVVVLAGVLLSAVFLLFQIGQNRKTLEEARWEKSGAPEKKAQPVALSQFDEARAELLKPFQSGTYSNRLMVSELRVSCVACQKPIPFFAAKCAFCGAQQPAIPNPDVVDSDADGIPDKYERDHGLNLTDAADAQQDSDADGFSNLEEFQSGTNPADSKDFPPPAAKLRLIRVIQNPFKLRFQGDAKLPDGSIRYQLNLRTLERTYFARIGDQIEGFKVLEYVPNAPEGAVIIVQQGDTRIRLAKGKVSTTFETVADMIFLIDRTRQRVRQDDTITIKDREYKVIDIKRDGVLIRDEKTKKNTLVGPLSESERSALMSGQENPTQPSSAFQGLSHPGGENR